MRPLPALISSALLVNAMASCSQPHRPIGSGPGIASPAPKEWPYAPASIQVHPLSRLLTVGRAEVRVECLDADGDRVKATGVMRVRVGEGDAAKGVEEDLNDRGMNALVWDPVLRDYKVLVPLPVGFSCSKGASLPVQVELDMGADRRLTAEGRIACP